MTMLEGTVMVVALFAAAVLIASLYWALLQRSARGRWPAGRPLYGISMLVVCVLMALSRWNSAEVAIGDLQMQLYLGVLVGAALVSGTCWVLFARREAAGPFWHGINILLFGLCLGLGMGTVDWSADGLKILTYLLPLAFLLSAYLQIWSEESPGFVGIVDRLRTLERMQRARH